GGTGSRSRSAAPSGHAGGGAAAAPASQRAGRPAPLGQEARRYLKERHAAGVGGPDDTDLGEAQPEFVRPQRQEHVEDVREAVVHEVDGGSGGENRPGARDHGAIIRQAPAPFKAGADASPPWCKTYPVKKVQPGISASDIIVRVWRPRGGKLERLGRSTMKPSPSCAIRSGSSCGVEKRPPVPPASSLNS